MTSREIRSLRAVGVVTPIALVLSVVAQKDTRNRLSRELGKLTWGKQNIAPTAKNTKMSVAWGTREKTLNGTAALKKSGGL